MSAASSRGRGAPFLETLEAALRKEKGLFPSFGHWFDLLKWLFDSLLEGLSDRTSRRRHMLMAFILIVAAFFVRVFAVQLSVRRQMPRKDVSLMMVMIPKGLAAVVLAGIPLQEGVAGGDTIRNITYGVLIFSIVFTSLLVFMQKKRKKPEIISDAELETNKKL